MSVSRARGWEIYGTMDMSRDQDSKSIFTFIKAPPMNKPWLCISFHESNKVRICSNGPSIIAVVQNHLAMANCIKDKKYFGKCFEFKVDRHPFLNVNNDTKDMMVTILVHIIKDLRNLGWKLEASVDISAKNSKRNHEKNPGDCHSLFFLLVG